MKSGFVALMGRPNAGKSTLLNALVNAKVAIVSEKAGTTRDNIRGIYNSDDAQIVFIDTPIFVITSRKYENTCIFIIK